MLEIGMFLVDRYEILAKIGTGGMADVYKAKDHILGRVVAIKVLKPEFSEDVNFVTKFRTEAQSAAGLEHPNIVNIYDVGSENGLHFIVMEHVEGITLKTYIEKKGQLSFKEATSIAIQVARGIEAAHNKEIIHRDIKPQNIIISTEGKVKVTDFGIARASSSNTISADVMGSVHYASPEQARNAYVDGRSDIYSLGIVMYEMVTGRVPFDGDTTVAVALQHLQEEMVGPSVYAPELPISYEKIVLKCTQKNPDRRYQAIGELLADLRKALVTPDEDFVVIAPLAAAAKTRIIGSDELEMIKDGAKNVDLKQETHFATEEDFEDADADEDDEDYDDDEEDAGFLNPKVEKVITFVGAGVLVLIVALIIYLAYMIATLPNRPGTEKNSQPTQTESQTESETESENETTLENLVPMIDITGMTVDEATEALEKLGLELFVGATQESDEEDGIILEQNVEEDEKVEKGTTITVVVSGENASQQLFAVPNVVGLTESEAIKMLNSNKFLYEKKYENSDDVEKGKVISQTPEYGKKAKQGSRVTIVISDGPEKVKVPALNTMEGKSVEDVSQILEDLGFKVNVLPAEYSDKYEDGMVINVTNAGKEVDFGSTIDVTVSKGKAPVITYEVSFSPAEKRPAEDVIAFSYDLYINGSLVKSRTEVTDFDTLITYSGSDISSAKIDVVWYTGETDEEGTVTYKEYGKDSIKITPVEKQASSDSNSSDNSSSDNGSTTGQEGQNNQQNEEEQQQ